MAKTKKFDLLEDVSFDSPVVDREAGVIKGVKILGRISRSRGREYSAKALREAATLYEQCGVNIDHPSRKTPDAERGVQEKIGWLESVVVQGDGVYGNLHFLKSHPYSETLCELAERNPKQMGMSHNAAGSGRQVGKKECIESIEKIRSVDLVQKPATTNGLFESEEPMKTLKQFVESIEGESPLKKCLFNLLEEDPVMAASDAPEMPAASSSEDQIKAAFRQAVMAAFDDESLDSKATLGKIKDILKAYDKLTGSAKSETPAPETSAASDTSAMESLQEELKSLKAKNSVRDLLESEGVASSPDRIAALLHLDSPQRKSLIATFKKADNGGEFSVRKPKSGSIMESEESFENLSKVPLSKAF